MRKVSDEIKGLQCEVTLTEKERAVLASYVKMEGFDIIQKLMEDQVRRFNLKLINTPNANKAEVLSHHGLAQSIAQFYVGLMNRIATECEIEVFNADIAPRNDMHIEELK